MANKDPIKVGVLFSREGATSRVETSMLLGTIFAIREINDAGGLDGRELVPVHYDPQSSAMRYADLASRLILDEKVNVIFGCYMSSSRKAVIPVVERWNKLLFYPTLYEGFEFSPNVIYTGGTPNQHSAPLANFMSRHFGPRVYMVGSDYIFPYESNRTMSDFILQCPGGKKLGERYVSLDSQERDFTAIVRDIKDKQPDFVFSTVVGKTTRMFYQAFADAGLDPLKMPIASLSTTETEVAEMGKRIGQGHYTAGPYFRSIKTPGNEDCVSRFVKLFGDRVEPNMLWEAAYFQVHLFANAFIAAGSDEHDILLPHVLGSEFDAPQGRVRVDPVTHHTKLYPRIGRVDATGQFTIMAEAAGGIEPDPYLVSHTFDDWGQALSLVAQDGQHG
ncbi:transporter substrate-binding domain-containing protein [Aquabacterium sp.]|uniref:transporter substrate-binding domain-containing protein n=1 Tax=Aquabacterium sp. TaxID=1872578 RepID=UPI003D6D6E15